MSRITLVSQTTTPPAPAAGQMTIYADVGGDDVVAVTPAGVTKSLTKGGLDPATAGEVSGFDTKAEPIAPDVLLCEDSTDSLKKAITIGSIKAETLTTAATDTTHVFCVGAGNTIETRAITAADLPPVTDADALHSGTAGEIVALTAAVPEPADVLVFEDSSSGDAKRKTTVEDLLSLAGGSSGQVHVLTARCLRSTLSTDYPVTETAPLVTDSTNPGILVRRFDDTTDEGVGLDVFVPLGATSLKVFTRARAQVAPGSPAVAKLVVYRREVAVGGAVPAWSAPKALSDVNLADGFFALTQTVDTLANWGLTEGRQYQFQLARTSSGNTLTGDLALADVRLEFE